MVTRSARAPYKYCNYYYYYYYYGGHSLAHVPSTMNERKIKMDHTAARFKSGILPVVTSVVLGRVFLPPSSSLPLADPRWGTADAEIKVLPLVYPQDFPRSLFLSLE